jgi:hypothetical protein
MRGGGKVKWRELSEGGAAGEFFLKSPAKIGGANKHPKDFDLSMLSANGATLAIPVLGEAIERVNLYDTHSGAFVGVFKLPPGRNYTRIRFSPSYPAMAVPAPYGVEIWRPFFYETEAESAGEAANVTLEYTASGDVITLMDAEKVRTLGLPALRNPDEIQHDLRISSVLRWPDQNHLLVGFSDFKIGYYQIEPLMKQEPLRIHHYDRESLSEAQKYIQRTDGLFLNLASSPDGRHFISWSEFAGAKIWDLQKPHSKARTLGSLHDIDQILYSHDSDAIWALQGREAIELSVFRAGGSHALVRTIPVGFDSRIRKTSPNFGIAVFDDTWPNLIIDSNTGLSLASFFHGSQGMTTPGAIEFRVVDETLIQSVDRRDIGENENAIDERRTGYRWRLDMAAPIRLSWDELLEIWKEASE